MNETTALLMLLGCYLGMEEITDPELQYEALLIKRDMRLAILATIFEVREQLNDEDAGAMVDEVRSMLPASTLDEIRRATEDARAPE